MSQRPGISNNIFDFNNQLNAFDNSFGQNQRPGMDNSFALSDQKSYLDAGGYSADDSIFKNWDSASTKNAIQGAGLGANIFFGMENLNMAKKNYGMKKEQHNAWMEDRAESKAQRDAVSKIRF